MKSKPVHGGLRPKLLQSMEDDWLSLAPLFSLMLQGKPLILNSPDPSHEDSLNNGTKNRTEFTEITFKIYQLCCAFPKNFVTILFRHLALLLIDRIRIIREVLLVGLKHCLTSNSYMYIYLGSKKTC